VGSRATWNVTVKDKSLSLSGIESWLSGQWPVILQSAISSSFETVLSDKNVF
jgi:hypothetical protein